MSDVIVTGVAGGTGSGKTTLVKAPTTAPNFRSSVLSTVLVSLCFTVTGVLSLLTLEVIAPAPRWAL